MQWDLVCRCLLEAGAKVSLQKDIADRAWACWTGSAAMAQVLVDAGADCNAVSYSGLTPLHAAVECGQSDVVSCLLKAGAAVDRPKFEPLGENPTPVIIAIVMGFGDIVQILLEGGADIERPDNLSVTPLGIAAGMGRADVVEVLLSMGAKRDGSELGHRPMTYAVAGGWVDCVRLLMNVGANINVTVKNSNFWESHSPVSRSPIWPCQAGGIYPLLGDCVFTRSQSNGKV